MKIIMKRKVGDRLYLIKRTRSGKVFTSWIYAPACINRVMDRPDMFATIPYHQAYAGYLASIRRTA